MAFNLNNIRYFFLSRLYNALLGRFYKRKIAALVEVVNREKGRRVLEIGVGTGLSLPFYSNEKEVVAIDSSRAMLNLAKDRLIDSTHPSVNVISISAEDYCAHASSFDQVVFCNVLSVLRAPKGLLQLYYNHLRPHSSIYILNHFTPPGGLLRFMDKLLWPVGKLFGFRSFFPVADLLSPEMMRNSSTTPLFKEGYWSIVKIKKP
jgi:phosphatidylethanolamine/phosphatidyl-N-methylethanolamine N-methyltransferase